MTHQTDNSTITWEVPKVGEIWTTKDTGRTFIVESVRQAEPFSLPQFDIDGYVFGQGGRDDHFFINNNNVFQWVKIADAP